MTDQKAEMGTIQSIHICGFYDDQGGPRLPDGGSPSMLSPYEHYRLIERNVSHFGGHITERKTTRTLDGWLVGVEFVVPAHGDAAAMWHRIAQPREVWADPTIPADPTGVER